MAKGDLRRGRTQPRLRTAALERIVAALKTRHAEAVAYRGRYVRAALVVALREQRATGIRITARGMIVARSATGSAVHYTVYTVPRPPELADFYDASLVAPRSRPAVLGPIGYADPGAKG